MATMTARRSVLRVSAGHRVRRPDTLAVEEPLEIRLGDQPFTVTMRTPGHDLDLAIGFLVAEGIVTDPGDVRSARHCPDAARDAEGNPTHNVVEVHLDPARQVDPAREAAAGGNPADGNPTGGSRAGVPPLAAVRPRQVSSACGVCGSDSIDAVRVRSPYDLYTDAVRLEGAVLAGLPDRLRDSQRVFARTGGLHAAGLFSAAGDLVCLREDVGRHNAVDKVVGWAFGQGLLPLRGHILQVSGRASFELVQKAWMAGVPALAAVSAPSSLAADLAAEAGLTLVGFSRGDSFNVYAGPSRLGTEGGGRQ